MTIGKSSQIFSSFSPVHYINCYIFSLSCGSKEGALNVALDATHSADFLVTCLKTCPDPNYWLLDYGYTDNDQLEQSLQELPGLTLDSNVFVLRQTSENVYSIHEVYFIKVSTFQTFCFNETLHHLITDCEATTSLQLDIMKNQIPLSDMTLSVKDINKFIQHPLIHSLMTYDT